MKKYILFSILMGSLGMLNSCIKRNPEPDNEDYYKNKIIQLRVENFELNEGDFIMMKIGATRVEEKEGPKPRIRVNGEEMTGDFFTLTHELILDGPVTIETIDSAWQYVIEYTFNSDASPYSLILTPSFNGIVQDPINFYVDKSLTGILEVKEYK